ncbi:hypothetical protein HYV85_06210 [Candidatus Woesearchaeota archaeon]|nr:hypothetical protein [Candidatus Woesearchaeota archaeon]
MGEELVIRYYAEDIKGKTRYIITAEGFPSHGSLNTSKLELAAQEFKPYYTGFLGKVRFVNLPPSSGTDQRPLTPSEEQQFLNLLRGK